MGYPYYKCIDIDKHKSEIFNVCFQVSSLVLVLIAVMQASTIHFSSATAGVSECVEGSSTTVAASPEDLCESATDLSLLYLIDSHSLGGTSQIYSFKRISAS